MTIPQIISVDDHVVEPADLWERWMPSQYQEWAPRLVTRRGHLKFQDKTWVLVEDEDGPRASAWIYFDLVSPIHQGLAATGTPESELKLRALHYEEMPPGCYDQAARLEAMDENHTEASLCFPTFPRFCGQTFLERGDRATGLAAVKAYNDWMIEEWCSGGAQGRLIPLTMVPLWDPVEAAQEVRRCAAKGSHAIAFSENPFLLGLPSIHSNDWDVLWQACEETDTVVNMHIGSSSVLPTVGPDTPRIGNLALTFEGSLHGLIDWLSSGVLERFGQLKIAFSEGQVGWMPFVLERMDNLWAQSPEYFGVDELLTRPPSEYIPGRVYGCVFDDTVGLVNRESIGMTQIMFETDYPHADSTWPHSRTTAESIISEAGLNDDDAYKLVRGNAIECYGLERFGISA